MDTKGGSVIMAKEYKPQMYRDMPQDVYNRALWCIRAKDRLMSELDDMIDARHTEEVPVKNREPSNPTAKIAEQREAKLARVQMIDRAFKCIPEEYREMVYLNITGTPMREIEGASEGTLHLYRKRVLIEVAHSTGDIDDAEYLRLLKKNHYFIDEGKEKVL